MTITEPSSTAEAPTLEVTRLSGSLGAEVRGFQIGEHAPVSALRELLREHLVLFFPGQHPDPDDHIAFGRLFGELDEPHFEYSKPERPEFFEVSAFGGRGSIADEWHSDHSFDPEPSCYSILHMKICPEFGGDTIWTNTGKAFDELSAPMRDLCEGLTALNDAASHFQPEKAAIHPVVRVHPETGRKSLYVNEYSTRRIVELSAEESALLLSHLTKWVQRPNFNIRYGWKVGTVAMWDNRATQHYVCNDFEGERLLQRVTVKGEAPEPVAAPRWEPHGMSMTAASWRDKPLIDFRTR